MIVLRFGQEAETHKEPKHELGSHARTPDNRRYYYSQNGPSFLPKGVVAVAEIPKTVEVVSILPSDDGKGQLVKSNPGIRVGITEADVRPNECYWMLTWGPGEILVDWMEVNADPRQVAAQSIALAWMYESDSGNYQFAYMTTAA